MGRKRADVAAILKKTKLFCGLDEDALLRLADSAVEKVYEKGRVICEKNQPAHTLYVIVSGRTTEFVVDDHELSCIARPNEALDYFGELGLLLEQSYLTTSVAVSRTELLCIPKEVFCDIAWADRKILQAVLLSLSLRLQRAGEKTISFVSFNAEGRLAYTLLRLHNDQGEVLATQENLSELCGIVRQTVSVILNGWKRQGVIDIHRGRIHILEIETLVDYFLSDRNIR